MYVCEGCASVSVSLRVFLVSVEAIESAQVLW